MIIPDFPWSNVFPMSFPFKVEIVHSKLRFSMFPPRFPPFQVEMLHDFPKFPQQNPPKKSVSSQQPAVFSCQASEPKINQLQMIRVLRSLKMMGIFWRKSHDGCHEFRATIHAWRKHAKNHDLYHGKTMRKTPRIPWNAMKHTMNKTEFIWNPQHTNWWWLCWIGGPLPHLGIVTFLGKMVKIINSSCQDATAKYKRLVEYSYFISIYPSIHPFIHSSIHPSMSISISISNSISIPITMWCWCKPQFPKFKHSHSEVPQTPSQTPRNIEKFWCHPPSLHRENSPTWCLGAPSHLTKRGLHHLKYPFPRSPKKSQSLALRKVHRSSNLVVNLLNLPSGYLT